MKTHKIGFIGGGNMASSLINGLIQSGHSAAHIWVFDIDHNATLSLSQNFGVNIADDNLAIAEAVDVVVLAVKPQALPVVARNISQSVVHNRPLVISIAAGISEQSLANWLGNTIAIVRCMPNTPALVRTGATALHANGQVTPEQRNLAESILRSVGLSLWVTHEKELDAVTAISGSGPAYFFLLMEAMENTAVELGLSAETARLLIQQTALGAAKIALEASESPEQLRNRVTSPGGTTEQAIKTFEQGNFGQLVANALHAAYNRAIELSIQTE